MRSLVNLRPSALAVLLAFSALLGKARTQSRKEAKDPLQRPVPAITLNKQSMFEAIAKVYVTTGIVISVERALGVQDTGRADPRFTATIPGGKAAVVLNEICALDGRYSWSRDGNMVNIYPRDSGHDANYLFNRKIPVFRLSEVGDAGSAAIRAVKESAGPPAQLIVLEVGSLKFAKPWTVEMEDITLRQAVDRIAEHLCGTCGWQLRGTRSTPTIMFYYHLKP